MRSISIHRFKAAVPEEDGRRTSFRVEGTHELIMAKDTGARHSEWSEPSLRVNRTFSTFH